MEVQELLVRIAGENSDLKRKLAETKGQLEGVGASSNKLSGTIKGNFAAMAGPVAAFAGPAALGLVVAGLVSATRNAIELASTLKDTAAQLNLSTDAYQELAFAAQLSGVKTDQFTMSIQTMNRMLGQAISGDEAAIKKFHDLGLQVEYLKRLSPDEVFEELADALSKLPGDAERTAAALEMFGRSGGKIAAMTKDGAAGVRELRAEAVQLGAVMDKDTIERAEELGDRFDALKTAVGIEFKTAILESTLPALEKLTEWLIKSRKAANDLKNAMPGATLEGIDAINSAIRGIDADIAKAKRNVGGVAGEEEARLAHIAQLESRRTYLAGQRMRLERAAEHRQQQEEQAKKNLKDKPLKSETKDPVTYDGWSTQAMADYAESMRQLGEIETAQADGLANAIKENEDMIADYSDDVTAQVSANVEQVGEDIAAQLEAQRTAVDDLIDYYSDGYHRLGDIAAAAIDDFGSLTADTLLDGKADWKDYFDYVLRMLIKQIVMQQIAASLKNAGGGFGAIGSALVSGLSGRESGGRTYPGTDYIVGEKRPEIFRPDQPGTILPSAKAAVGATPVSIRLINNGTPQQVSSASATVTPEGVVVSAVLADLNRSGPITQSLSGAFGLRKGGR